MLFAIERKVRIDDDMNQRLLIICERLGCTIADGIRTGIQCFLDMYAEQAEE